MATLLDPDGGTLADPDGDPITFGDEPELPGATRDVWGDIRLHVWLALGRGNVMKIGPDPGFSSGFEIDPDLDRLDSGNVVGSTAGAVPVTAPSELPGLWVDVTCDAVQVETRVGASPAAGLYAKTEAGSAVITLADPTRRYDPVNPNPDFAFEDTNRLRPGVAVLIWAETAAIPGFEGDGPLRRTLFTGKVDTIAEGWTPHASARRAVLTASDGVADLANRERPELVEAVGQGETTTERIERILDYFDGPAMVGTVYITPPAFEDQTHVQATTMRGSAWEELQRTVADEIGFLTIVPAWHDPYSFLARRGYQVRYLTRDTWDVGEGATGLTVGCDVVIAAVVTASDGQQRTRVTGRRALAPGEEDVIPTQRSERTRSVPALRELGYSNADLGVVEDEVVEWVEFVLDAFQTPDVEVRSVTLRPAADPDVWPQVLVYSSELAAAPVRLEWAPPGEDFEYAVRGLIVGVEHSITTARWEVRWDLAQTSIVATGGA